MRLSYKRSKELQKEAKQLFSKGFNQKEIANKLEITETTVGVWLKPFKEIENKKAEIQIKLINRINKALTEDTTPIKDLFCLCQSLYMFKNSSI